MGCCEHVNETENFVKGGQFPGMLNDYHFLKGSDTLRCCVIVSNLKYPVVLGADWGGGRKARHLTLLDFLKKKIFKKKDMWHILISKSKFYFKIKTFKVISVSSIL